MNSFELFLLLTLCTSFVVVPWLGYRAGYRDGKATGYEIGKRVGYDFAQGESDHLDRITAEMPIVPITVNGDEVDLSPKRAADVRRPE